MSSASWPIPPWSLSPCLTLPLTVALCYHLRCATLTSSPPSVFGTRRPSYVSLSIAELSTSSKLCFVTFVHRIHCFCLSLQDGLRILLRPIRTPSIHQQPFSPQGSGQVKSSEFRSEFQFISKTSIRVRCSLSSTIMKHGTDHGIIPGFDGRYGSSVCYKRPRECTL